jgi:hypothetical protein
VDRFILAMPSLVNKSKRRIFAVVKERQQLADALARYLGLLGLERRARPVPSLAEYLARRRADAGSTSATGPTPEPSPSEDAAQAGTEEAR